VGLELPRGSLESISILGRDALRGDVGPYGCMRAVHFDPTLGPLLGVGYNCLGGAFWLTYATIDTLVRVNDQHVFTFIEAVDRANFNTVHVLAANASFGDGVGHGASRINARNLVYPQASLTQNLRGLKKAA